MGYLDFFAHLVVELCAKPGGSQGGPDLVCPSLVHFLVILPPNIPTTYTQHCKISRFTFCWFNWKLCQIKFYIILIVWQDRWIDGNKTKSKHFFFRDECVNDFQILSLPYTIKSNFLRFCTCSWLTTPSFRCTAKFVRAFSPSESFLTHWALRTRTQLKLNKVMTIQQKPHTRHSPFPLFLFERRLNH